MSEFTTPPASSGAGCPCNVAPLAMSPALFEAYRTFAQPLTAADRASLVALRDTAALADCVPLIDTLLASDQKLEQEAVDIAAALKEILQISRREGYHHNRSTHPGIV